MRLLRRLSLLLALLPLTTVYAVRPVKAAATQRTIPQAHLSGTVVGFDNSAQLLSVNTRLGLKRLLVNNRTLVLLNNHTAALTAITAGDEVTVDYQYDTSIANTIHLFREASRSGTVVSTTTNGISLRLKNGAILTLTTNAGSVVELGGIPLTSNSVLVGRRVTAIYEPGTFTLLSLAGSSKTVKGTITAIDPVTRSLIISGRNALTFDISDDATVRRAGSAASLTDLAVGDRVVVAFLRDAGIVRALAIDARAGTVTPTGTTRKN